MTENPLLSLEFPIPFDRIRPEHVVPAVETLIAEARQRVADLTAQSAPADFENTMRPLDRLTEGLDRTMSVVKHLESVAATPELRAAIGVAEPMVSDFHAGLQSNHALWERVEQLASSGDEMLRLDKPQRRFLGHWHGMLRKRGAGLNPADKESLAAMQRELAALTGKFAENVRNATDAFELVIPSGDKLGAMSFPAVRAARASAERKSIAGWRFTLHPSSYGAVMRDVPDGALREQMYRAEVTKASAGAFDNRPMIRRILDLRHHVARLLGYDNYAELVLSGSMGASTGQVLSFLKELREKLEAPFLREEKSLREYHARLTERSPGPLQPWDVYFYATRQAGSVEAYAIPPSYFQLDRVIAGLFEIARRLYGIRIQEEPGVTAWNPEAKYYSIQDEDGTVMGGFYADWFPRENKRRGAWMRGILTGGPSRNGFRPHIAALCANVTRPSPGWPALLPHHDVQTIFHEFGHLLHHCLSRVELRSLAGTNVSRDFVELPSQMMENWCWERPALDLFARNHRTTLPIPDHLFWDAERGRRFLNATRRMLQVGISVLDLKLHSSYDPETDGDVMDYSRRVLEEYSLTPLLPEDASIASLSHLFGPVGYAGVYYSYAWSEILAADAFSRFRAGGILSSEIGREYRAKILAPGGGDDPSALYRDFMGRDPDSHAFFDREGLN